MIEGPCDPSGLVRWSWHAWKACLSGVALVSNVAGTRTPTDHPTMIYGCNFHLEAKQIKGREAVETWSPRNKWTDGLKHFIWDEWIFLCHLSWTFRHVFSYTHVNHLKWWRERESKLTISCFIDCMKGFQWTETWIGCGMARKRNVPSNVNKSNNPAWECFFKKTDLLYRW